MVPGVDRQIEPVQFPADVRCRVTTGRTLEGHSGPRLQRLLDEAVQQHWRGVWNHQEI